MTPNPHRLADLDAAIADCALDAMLVFSPEPAAEGSGPTTSSIPEPAYDIEVDRQTLAYGQRRATSVAGSQR